jgi:hypothetical protein
MDHTGGVSDMGGEHCGGAGATWSRSTTTAQKKVRDVRIPVSQLIASTV